MKIYSCPKEIPAPEPDYSHYDAEKEDKAEADHLAALKAWLIKQGHTGKYTGEIYRDQVADGYAQYMVGDGKYGFFLIHLPYGDAYNSRDVQFLPKKEIIRRLEAEKKFAALFAAKAE
jgi:hypothetical protein